MQLLPRWLAAVDPLHPARLDCQKLFHRDRVSVVLAAHAFEKLGQPSRDATLVLRSPDTRTHRARSSGNVTVMFFIGPFSESQDTEKA